MIIKRRAPFKKWIESHKNSMDIKWANNGNNDKNIYIDCFITDWLAAFLPRLIYASALREKVPNCNLIALYDKKDNDVSLIVESYGIRILSVRKKVSLIKAIVTSIRIYLFNNNIKKIYSLRYRGVEIGKYLSETLIRHSDDLFTVERIRLKDLKHVINFYWIAFL